MAHKRNDIPVTISFSENSRGWTSFKSFLKENGISLNNRYYTFKNGHLWEHHENETRGSYYGGTIQQASGLWSNTDSAFSHVEVLFNDAPGSVKSFGTLNYEGSQAKNTPDITNDAEYYNNFLKMGWYVEEVMTNLQSGVSLEFKDKEDKWFSQVKGETTEWLDDGKAGNIDTREFSVQGIGNASDILCPTCPTVFTSWDCNPGTVGITGTTATSTGDPLGDCDGKTILTMPAGSTWDDFGDLITDPANGYTTIPTQQLGVCLEPYTGWGNMNPSHQNTGEFDWATQWCNPPLGRAPSLGFTPPQAKTCCGCGDNGDGVYLYGWQYFIIEHRNEKALGPPDPLTNPNQFYYVKNITDSASQYTSWEAYLTSLLGQQSTLNINPTTTNRAGLVAALDQFYNDLNASDPTYNYFWEYTPVETKVCDCETPGPGTPAVPGTPGIPAIPCECVERQDLLGQYMTELDCLSTCCPQPVTSWNCTSTPSTSGTDTCTDVYNASVYIAPAMNFDSSLYDWLSGPQSNVDFSDKKMCVPYAYQAVWNPNNAVQDKCDCQVEESMDGTIAAGQPGFYIAGFRWNYNSTNIHVGPGGMNSWIIFITAIIATGDPVFTGVTTTMDWNSLTSQMQSNITNLSLDQTLYGTTPPGSNFVIWAPTLGHHICECTGSLGSCDCVEVLDASGDYSTEPNCLATCCGIVVPSWDCDNGSCIDPGTGLGLYGTLSACNAVCSSTITPSWDCVSGNCIDPGTGAGLHSTFSACNAVCGGTSTAIIPCDWESGGHTTGLRHKLKQHPNAVFQVSVRPGATNGSDIVPFAVTSGTYIHDPAVFFSTHPGGNTWNVGSFPGFPGWDVDDSFMVRATGGVGDMIKMPSGRCWEMRNSSLFPPQQSWNPAGQYSQKAGGVAPYFYAGSFYGPHQVPYWHSYLGKNPEEPGNEDWWRECDCGQPVNFWL